MTLTEALAVLAAYQNESPPLAVMPVVVEAKQLVDAAALEIVALKIRVTNVQVTVTSADVMPADRLVPRYDCSCNENYGPDVDCSIHGRFAGGSD